MKPTTVRVDRGFRGAWEIQLPGRGDRIRCRTLDEANQVARRYAADQRPSEIVVCDAYHRVMHRELIGVGGE